MIHRLMDKANTRRYLSTTLICLLAVGCIPYSDNPLTDPDKNNRDLSLCGTWYWRDKNELGFVHIGLDEKSGLLRVIMLDLDKENRIDVCEFMGHTSRLDKNSYLNLKWVRPNNQKKGYIFVKYQTASDSIAISMLDRNAVIKAIETAALKGKVTEGKWFSSVHITEGQKTLQQFILAHDKNLFKETKLLQKLNLPEKDLQPAPTNCPALSPKVKLPAPRGGGSAVRQCFAARKGRYLFQIASLNPALKCGACREANRSKSS